MPFDTSQLIPVDNEFSDAAMFIPIESDETLNAPPELGSGPSNVTDAGFSTPILSPPPSSLRPILPERLTEIEAAQKQAQQDAASANTAAWLAAPFTAPIAALDKAAALGGAVFRDLRSGNILPVPFKPGGQGPLWEATRSEIAGTPLPEQETLPVIPSIAQQTIKSFPDVATAMAASRAGIPPEATFGTLTYLRALREGKPIPEAIQEGAIMASVPPAMKMGEVAVAPLAQRLGPEAAKLVTAAGRTAGSAIPLALPQAGEIVYSPERGKILENIAGNVAAMGAMEIPALVGRTTPQVRRLSEIEARQKVTPEDPKLLEEKSKIVQEAIDTAEKANPEVPIRGAKGTEVLTHEGVPIWVNETGEVIVNPQGMNAWTIRNKLSGDTLKKWVAAAFPHEVIHSNFIKMEGEGWKDKAKEYFNNATALEKKLTERSYFRKWGKNATSEVELGSEMYRRQMERMLGLTPTEVVQSRGMEWLTQNFIDGIERALLSARESLGTEASKAQRELLNKYIDRYQKKIDQIRQIKGWKPPEKEEPKQEPVTELGLEPPKPLTPEVIEKEKPEDIISATAKASPEARGAMWASSGKSLTKNLIETGEKAKGNPEAIKSLAEAYHNQVESPEAKANLAALRKQAIRQAALGDDKLFNNLSIHDQVLGELLEGATGAAEVKATNQAEYNARMAKAFEDAGVPVPDKFKTTEPVSLGMEPAQKPKPEEKPKELTPILRAGNVYVKGRSHAEAMQNALKAMQQGKITPQQFEQIMQAHADNAKHEFVTETGKVLNREEGANAYESMTGKRPALPNELHSEQLQEAGLLKHLEKGFEPVGQVSEPAVTLGMEPAKPKQKEEKTEREAVIASVQPKIDALKQTLAQSVSKSAALREYFRGQQKAGQLALQTTRQQLKETDDWLEADARNIGQSLSQLVRQVLPKSEQGRFLTRITQAMKRAPILSKDPSIMYERASKLAAEIDDYATRYHEITQRNALTDEIRASVEKALESPTVDINYKNQIRELVKNLRLAKTSQEKIRQLESRKAFVDRMRAEGKENPVPEEYMKELELLSQTSPNDLPIEVLQSMRDRIQLLTDLGRKSVKGRAALFNAERDAMAAQVQQSNATALNDIPQQRTPGLRLPLAQRLMQAVGNKFNTALNAGLKLGRALYQRDVMLDIMDKDANYEGGLIKTFGWGLDKAYNKSMNLKDDWMAPLKDVVSKNKIDKTSAERISIYAISQEANGMKRLMESGVTPETIAQVRKTITPAELQFYTTARKVFDDIIYPQLRDFMRDNYNIEVNKVDNYWPFQRDWTQFEAQAKPTAGEQVPGTAPGQQVGFDELAAWKALQENWNPRTTTPKKGMTIERVPEAEGAVRLNALDVVDQHISQAAHLLGQQRTLKMLGQIARQEWFKQKYGNLGQQYILNLLDTVARNGDPSGASRWLALDALRRNTSVGIIGLRLLSQMKHAPNWAFTLAEVRPKHIRDGIVESISDKGQEFIKKNFAEIYQRYGGEPAIAEIGSKGWWQNIQKHSFFLERGIDAIHARATVLGAYFQALAKKGIDPSRYTEIPLDEAAAREALIISRKGVTSPLLKDIPQSVSRGAVTGGNVSLGRAIFQFQNTMLRQWGFMKHDIFDLAIKNWKPGKAATAVLAFASMLAAETLIVETNKLLIEKLSHKLFDTPMARPTKQEREEENVPEYLKFGKNMATELFRRVPFVGNVVAMSKYKELGIPVIDTMMDSMNTVYQGATAKSERGKERAIAKGIGTAATLAGVPGASTALQLYLKGNPPLRTRTRQAPQD